MNKRNYPTTRKPAGLWECPFCNKQIGIRGKSGHLKLFHPQSILSQAHNPFFFRYEIIPKRRPLAKADVRNLINGIRYLISLEMPNHLLDKRKTYLKCEFLIRQLEIQFKCTLEDALKKFPDLAFNLDF